MLRLSLLSLSALFLLGTHTLAQVDPRGRSILFVRGGDGTGGLGSGSLARRTEHLSDIRNTTTGTRNHGFGALAALLRGQGFRVSQWIETQGRLDAQRLAPHRIVVFGSNNRVYTAAEVAAFERWFRSGGSALFVSDANWGPNWNAAPASDNQFLKIVGVSCYQDSASGVPVRRRTASGHYVTPAHPVVSGPDGVGGSNDVDEFEGEGVSYFEVVGTSAVRVERVVSAIGRRVRLLSRDGRPGTLRNASARDCAIFGATLGNGRIVGHYDRNSWFNRGGVGSDITRRDNAKLALRIFEWLASVPARTTMRAGGCSRGVVPVLNTSRPVLGQSLDWTLAPVPTRSAAVLLIAGVLQRTQPFPACPLVPDIATAIALPLPAPDARGRIRTTFPLPLALRDSGAKVWAQAIVVHGNGQLFGALDLSSGRELTLGWPF